ncbi:hypothetical protein L596_019593 [Steinernema carpocapsae]|uniref:Uncharacterized protein n=1 Tax=Steinernema carpocapsae TaxID=34508 RepID=A0A4U5MQZ0_STECR|nr:hypothetical protein L596_019593 [Steinernema carpocapsae]
MHFEFVKTLPVEQAFWFPRRKVEFCRNCNVEISNPQQLNCKITMDIDKILALHYDTKIVLHSQMKKY